MTPALTGARREFTARGVGRLSYYLDAPAAQASAVRPLVLLHSIHAAGSAYEVKPLYDHYRHERPVYALDLPGFGFSERSNRAYTPRLMTDAIHTLLAQIRSEHAGIAVDAIALSLSAEFLARVAAESPGVVRSLAFVSPTGLHRMHLREGPLGSTLGRPWLFSVIGRPAVGRWLFGQLTRRGVLRYFLRRAWGSVSIDEGLLDYDFAITRQEGAEHAPLRFMTGFLFAGDSGTVYRTLLDPVWVVHGVAGDFLKYKGLRQFARLPNWTIEVLPTGALPHFQMPQEFIRRYDAWSASIDEPRFEPAAHATA